MEEAALRGDHPLGEVLKTCGGGCGCHKDWRVLVALGEISCTVM